MTPSEIIAELGGPADVAAALAPSAPGGQLVPNTVVHWCRRGVPPRYWLAMSRRAAELGKATITIDVIEQASLAAAQAEAA